MRYFAHQAIDGAWHTVYTLGDGTDMISVCCGGSEQTHRHDAQLRQAKFDREVEASLRERDHITAGVHRRLAPWYDEREAR